MQIAQQLSGFSLGHADILRRAMGKKNKSEMKAQRQAFVDGAVARGTEEAKAAQIFDEVDKFAGYGFNKSHAAAYALIAYQTAWLKANHPTEFFAASMSLELGNTDKLNVFRQELDRLGIPLLPPDINQSDVTFTVCPPGDDGRPGGIRYALAAIRNVGAQAMAEVVAERTSGGPFRGIYEFAERVGNRAANKRQLENLVHAGAFDSLEPNRRRLFEGIEFVLKVASAAAFERDSNQANLFGEAAGGLAAAYPALADVTDWPEMERLNHEFEAVGFYLSAHPLNAYGPALERLGVVSFESLDSKAAGQRPRLAGIVVGRRERTSAKGNRYAFVQLSGIDGVFEVVVFSEVLAASRDLLDSGRPVLLTAEVRADGEGVRLSAQNIEDLDAAAAKAVAGLKIRIDRAEALDGLKRAIAQGRGGRGRVSLILDTDEDQAVEITLPGGYAISAQLRAALGAVPGIVELRDI